MNPRQREKCATLNDNITFSGEKKKTVSQVTLNWAGILRRVLHNGWEQFYARRVTFSQKYAMHLFSVHHPKREYPARFELAISRFKVWRDNHYTTGTESDYIVRARLPERIITDIYS